jgi:hypothetical protein
LKDFSFEVFKQQNEATLTNNYKNTVSNNNYKNTVSKNNYKNTVSNNNYKNTVSNNNNNNNNNIIDLNGIAFSIPERE